MLPLACRQLTTPEKETSPLTTELIQIASPITITLSRPPKENSTYHAIIQKPTTPPSSPESPRAKKPRIKSWKYTTGQPIQYFHVKMENAYSIHEKYDLQDIHAIQGHCKSNKTAQRRRRNQHRPPGLLHLPPGEQTLVTHQRAYKQVLWWTIVQQHQNAANGNRRPTDQHSVLVWRSGAVLRGSHRGRWRTTIFSACVPRLPW